jgi:DedD protein
MVKQRVVGFIVLGALAVIFWPIVFVSPEPEQELVLPIFDMPERPVVAMSERREPVLERVDRSRLPTIERTAPSEGVGIDEVTINPSLELIAADTEPLSQDSSRQRADFDDQGLPVSWELQVATFSSTARAEEIALELRGKGYKAYVSHFRRRDQRLFRVMIGPKLQKQRLLEMQPVIDDYFSVKSIIVKFVPK